MAAGPKGFSVLAKVSEEMSLGCPPWGINLSQTAFVPKKKFVPHLGGVAAAADNLRALSMKNCDVKTVSGCILEQVNPIVAKFAHPSQR
eukprot:3658987-Karenia_brevis.AAC.1